MAQDRAASVISDDNEALPYPGPKSPTPPEDALYFPEPDGEPISPEMALNILQTYGNSSDVTTLRVIALRLVGTLKKREINHNKERERLIRECDEAEEHLDHVHDTPDGYIENDGHAPAFIIPTGNGEYEPAYYIKKLLKGQVAGHPESYAKRDVPFIADLFMVPSRGSMPSAPIPNWLLAILTGHASQFEALVHAIQQHDNWGLEADIRRVHATDNQTAVICH